jgi:hypothetical protein
MSSRNPDTSAAVMVTLFGATMLACLLGAFVLPPSGSGYKALGIVLAALVIALPWLSRVVHRSRIRHAVEDIGGRVIHIRRLPFWKQDYSFWSRRHRVKHEVHRLDWILSRSKLPF